MIYYHSQEKREVKLASPIKCTKPNALLGNAYYFWMDENDAIIWGRKSKKKTGFYEIYKANISHESVLDTVFNEEQYFFWLKQVEKIASKIIKKTGNRPTIKEINDFIRDKNLWKDVSGIRFQDIPENEDYILIEKFFYKKRIQLAVFNLRIVTDFNFHYGGKSDES